MIGVPQPLDWHSDLTAKQVFSSGELFSYPTPLDAQQILYLGTIKQEGSRQALMLLDGANKRCVSPRSFNLATQISEYGGKPFCLFGRRVVFANREDQCLYYQDLEDIYNSQPVLLTSPSEHGKLMYAEPKQLDSQTAMVIVEQQVDAAENRSYLASLDLSMAPCRPIEILQGADFYSNLVVDSKQQKVAWVEWDHPNMPWDENRLFVADYQLSNGVVVLAEPMQIELDATASYCQLCFSNNGKLLFSADRQVDSAHDGANFWNLYSVDLASEKLLVVEISALEQEFGYPHWQYADRRIVQFDEQRLISIGSSVESDSLFFIDQDSLEMTLCTTIAGRVHSLASDRQGHLTMIEQHLSESAKIVSFSNNTFTTRLCNPPAIAANQISEAEHISYQTSDGAEAYGYYYAPKNSRYPENLAAPPLLVMVHGGPTSRAYGCFDIQKQFWTNRGFAIFDVNHRGSSGYGRQYRDALYGHWGIMDSNDIVDGIRYLVDRGLAHPQQICIRGKSAGGYAVLCALPTAADIMYWMLRMGWLP